MEIPDNFYYASAPTSPSKWNLENTDFYSVPTSPTRGVSSAPFGFETAPTSPRTYEDADSTLDDFEFETSRRFNVKDIVIETSRNFKKPLDHQEQQQKQQRQRGDSLPSTMAFADELFCDGKVLPLTPPLKLPPRLQHVSSKSGNQSSTASSPRSPSSVLKIPFSPRRIWNDDFDPFTVALENVREEKRGKTQANNHRRARSLSPLRAARPHRSNDSVGLNNHQDKYLGHPITLDQSAPNSNEPSEPNGFSNATWTNSCDPVKQVGGSPMKLAEPKGLSFARQVRLVKIGNELPSKPNITTPSGPTVEAGKTAKENGGSSTRESKRQKIKNFLFRNASMSKVNEDKKREQNAASWKLTFYRKLSFKSVGSAQYNGDRTLAKVPNITVIPYRPRLLLCMGFGENYVK